MKPLLLALTLGLLTGCESPEVNTRDSFVRTARAENLPINTALKRTAYQRWAAREFPGLGAHVEFPSNAYVIAKHDEEQHLLFISLHPLKPPGFILAEPQYLLTVTLKRKSKEQFVKDLNDPFRRNSDEFWEWMAKKHASVSRRDVKAVSYFRKDVECKNGDVITLYAELINIYESGFPIYLQDDDQAVQRMFDSVRPSR